MNKFVDIFQHFGLKSFFVSLGLGLVAKVFAVIIFAVVYFIDKILIDIDILSFYPNHVLQMPALENDPFSWTYSPGQIIIAVVLAPVWENLKIPLLFYLSRFISKSNILPIIIITVLAFFLHGMGVYGLGGASAFAIFSIFYGLLHTHIGWQKAYGYSVIAHSSANILSLIASLT